MCSDFSGNGTIFVFDIDVTGIKVAQQFDWSDGVFDVCWAENNENVVIGAGGDGSVQVWDVHQPKVDRLRYRVKNSLLTGGTVD